MQRVSDRLQSDGEGQYRRMSAGVMCPGTDRWPLLCSVAGQTGDAANLYHNWTLAWNHFGWLPEQFDIGITTAESLRRLEQGVPAAQAGGRREGDNGNGALMRILPLLGRLSFDPAQAVAEFRLVQDVAGVTHGHVRSAAAC